MQPGDTVRYSGTAPHLSPARAHTYTHAHTHIHTRAHTHTHCSADGILRKMLEAENPVDSTAFLLKHIIQGATIGIADLDLLKP